MPNCQAHETDQVHCRCAATCVRSPAQPYSSSSTCTERSLSACDCQQFARLKCPIPRFVPLGGCSCRTEAMQANSSATP
jgi:hypothetical protein